MTSVKAKRSVASSGVFLKFHYLRISINIILCNPNFIHSESLLPCFRGRK